MAYIHKEVGISDHGLEGDVVVALQLPGVSSPTVVQVGGCTITFIKTLT